LERAEHDQFNASPTNTARYGEATDEKTADYVDNAVANDVCNGSSND
jgi:hypothetical protein